MGEALAIYAAIGIANTALLWSSLRLRPKTWRDYVSLVGVVFLWPPVLAFAIYMGLSDSGR